MTNAMRVLMVIVGLTVLVGLGLFVFAYLNRGLAGRAQAFQTRAFQTEAKASLTLVFAHMRMQQAELGYFPSTDLSELEETSGLPEHYLVGFVKPFKTDDPVMQAVEPERRWLGKRDAGLEAEAERLCPDCTVSKDDFKAIAIGRLPDGTLDAWVVSFTDKDPKPLIPNGHTHQ